MGSKHKRTEADVSVDENHFHSHKKKKNIKSSGSPEEPENDVIVDVEAKKKKKKEKKKERKNRDINGVDTEDINAMEIGNGVENGGKKIKKNKGSRRQNKGSDVSVSGKGSEDTKYSALESFEEAGLPDRVLECCKSFQKPSPIQAHAWPYLLNGRDFIGIAATGSGKTLAFGVPALMHILQKEDRKAMKKSVPLCLVLSPTRELAQQIADVLADAGKSCGVKSVCLYGGTSKGPQISAMKSGHCCRYPWTIKRPYGGWRVLPQ